MTAPKFYSFLLLRCCLDLFIVALKSHLILNSNHQLNNFIHQSPNCLVASPLPDLTVILLFFSNFQNDPITVIWCWGMNSYRSNRKMNKEFRDVEDCMDTASNESRCVNEAEKMKPSRIRVKKGHWATFTTNSKIKITSLCNWL